MRAKAKCGCGCGQILPVILEDGQFKLGCPWEEPANLPQGQDVPRSILESNKDIQEIILERTTPLQTA